MPKAIRRKICFPITSRVHYARQRRLLDLIKKNPRLELQLVVGGSVLLEKYGEQFLPEMAKAGFSVSESLYNVIEGGNHITMAKTAGLTALEFSNSLSKLNPDIVLIRGDRFEQLAMAMVAAYMNKTIAHIEGGDITGTIDESVRHAITKLAHVHFVTNEDAKRRVIQMGEDPKSVFNVGSPDIEFAALSKKRLNVNFINSIGAGHKIDFTRPYIMVMHHPVTTEKNNRRNAEILLEAVDELNIPAIWFWPNHDAGTNEIAKAIRVYRENGMIKNDQIKFVTDVAPDDFIALLKGSKALVGNSSAGIKECSYLGVPVVNIGTRQQGRLRSKNVLDVGYGKDEMLRAIRRQISHLPFPTSHLYYKPDTSKNIVNILNSAKLVSQKRFYESRHI